MRDDQATIAMMEKYPHFSWGVAVTLMASVCSGIAYLTMRKIGTKVNSVVITMYFGAFMLPSCLAMSLLSGDSYVGHIGGTETLLLSLAGLFGWIAQEGVSKAVGMAEASSMAPINYV